MPSHILVNNLGLTYKGTIGISTATIPDVCKTPSPGGPVPIPYPNFASQSSLKGGTTTVKAKGKMIAVKGSQYGRSNGDEPGTVGGVKSNVNMKATDWITYSFDVKMDGKNACRHTDKKFHNNKNTVDCGGNLDFLHGDYSKVPDDLSPEEEQKAKECADLHAEYKYHQSMGNSHRRTERGTLKDAIRSGTASATDIDTFVEIEIERTEHYQAELEKRQKYVGQNCDRFEWKDTKHPSDPEARRAGHIDAIDNRLRQLANMPRA